MKCKALIIFLLLTSNICSGQLEKQDSIGILLKKEQLANEDLKKRIDILQNKITKFEINANYFQSTMESMTGIFSAICGAFFILFGLITYSGFKKEVKKIRRDSKEALNKQQEKFDTFFQNVENIEEKLTFQSARTYVLIAKFFETSKLLVGQIENNLRASLEFSKLGKQEKGCKSNIQLALKAFKEISLNGDLKETVKSNSKDLIALIDKISKADNSNEEIKDLLAELRISIKNYIK